MLLHIITPFSLSLNSYSKQLL